MKTALIIGITGQDGAYLARLLLGKGYAVVGSSRDAQLAGRANLIRLGIERDVRLESLAVKDFRNMIQVLEAVAPDEVYNLAGQSSVGLSFLQPLETFESICVGTINLMEAVRMLAAPARIYNAASSECFGNTGSRTADESTPFLPRSPYAVAKAAAYWQVANYREAYGLFAASGLLFNHESPLRPERFVTRKIVTAACALARGEGETLRLGNLGIRRDWGWAPEYVEAMWLMLQQERPEDFVVATGRTHSLEEFLEVVFETLGLSWRDHVEVNPELLRPTDIQESRADPSRIRRILGWRARFAMRDVARMMVEAELRGSAF